MRIFLVNAGANYYPTWDNTKFVTESLERAEELKQRFEKSGKYDWVEIIAKGVDQ